MLNGRVSREKSGRKQILDHRIYVSITILKKAGWFKFSFFVSSKTLILFHFPLFLCAFFFSSIFLLGLYSSFVSQHPSTLGESKNLSGNKKRKENCCHNQSLCLFPSRCRNLLRADILRRQKHKNNLRQFALALDLSRSTDEGVGS